MGVDTPLAVLSDKSKLIGTLNIIAQVTNPPIDLPEPVMSLTQFFIQRAIFYSQVPSLSDVELIANFDQWQTRTNPSSRSRRLQWYHLSMLFPADGGRLEGPS